MSIKFFSFILGLWMCLSLPKLGFSQTMLDKPEDISPLLVGENIPEVSLQTYKGKSFNLLESVKSKPTIIVFYRGGWCPYCTRQLSGFLTIEADLQKLGYQVLAISPDKPSELQKTVDKFALTYQLLSDSKMEVSQKFGIAYRNEKYGAFLEEPSGEKHHLLPVPSVFVVNRTGVIKFEYINPNYKERINPQLLLTAAELALLEQ
jgi:peroxiredoxin